jgi:anti-sigma regulatory factor (Ser/Thr protein kinase)
MTTVAETRSDRRCLLVRRFSADPHAPALARALVRALPIDEERRDDVCLVVSELVTNSVVHGGDGPDRVIELRAELRAGTLRVEVADRGPGFDPALVPPPSDVPGGRGLLAVHRLADRWGVGTNHATRAWVEFWLDGLSRHFIGPDLPLGARGAWVHFRARRADLAARRAAILARRRRVDDSLREAARRREQIGHLLREIRTNPHAP